MFTPDVTAVLLARIPHRKSEVQRRQIVREAGALGNEVILVKSGVLSLSRAAASAQHTVALRYPGEVILPGSRPAPAGIQAIDAGKIIIAKADDFYDLIDDSSEMRRLLLRIVQRNEAISYEWLVNCGRRDSLERVAHLLCETAFRLGQGEARRMRLPFTQQQMAAITGQTPVNVNRMLAELRRQGLIRRQGRDVEFLDWPEMERLASFHTDYLKV